MLITAMQAARPQQLWAASLLSASIGLLAFTVLAGARILFSRRFGSTIAQGTDHRRPRTKRLRLLVVEIAAVASLVLVAVTVWWAWIELGDVAGIVVPRPSAVWEDLSSEPGEYLAAAGATLTTAAAALAIGTAVGLTAALVASRVPLLAGMTVPVVVIMAATPLVALFPLFARVFGYQPNTVRLLAAVMVFYPVFIYTRSGLQAASPPVLDVVDALGEARAHGSARSCSRQRSPTSPAGSVSPPGQRSSPPSSAKRSSAARASASSSPTPTTFCASPAPSAPPSSSSPRRCWCSRRRASSNASSTTGGREHE